MPSIIALIISFIVVVYFLRRGHNQGQTAKPITGPTPQHPRQMRGKGPPRDWAAIVAKAQEIAALQTRPAVALVLGQTANSDDPHSCIGGQPSLPAGMAWPVDENGKPMLFVAQINFAEMPHLDGYPTKGLLSFFIMNDDLNGCAFPSTNGEGFQVHYFDDATSLHRQKLPEADWDFSPFSDRLVQEGRRVTGTVFDCGLSGNSATVADLTDGWYPDCPSDMWDRFETGLSADKPAPHYFGGHPDFTQQDFRRDYDDTDYTSYSEVLLQIGYLPGRDTGIDVCWGDAGEASFTISKADLAAGRFDRVAYNWDCH